MTYPSATALRSYLVTLGVAAIPVAYVLTMFLDQGVSIVVALRAVAVTSIGAVSIIVVVSILIRDRLRGALVGACVIGVLVTWKYSPVASLFAITGIVIVIDRLVARKTGRFNPADVRIIHGVVGGFGILLLMVTVLQFASRGQVFDATHPATAIADRSDGPDIWLVLMDGYPRSDALLRDWGFDNSQFVHELEAMGFDVAEGSRSNYNSTKLTLPSMFNMALLTDMKPFSDFQVPADAPAARRVQALQSNRAVKFLRERGWHTTSVGAGYTHETIRSTDQYIDAGTADVVELFLIGESAIGELLRHVDPDFGESQIRQRIQANLGTIERLARAPSDQPRFVFVHLPGPHPPLVYGDASRPFVPLRQIFDYPVAEYGEDLLKESYRDNIDHFNELVLRSLRGLTDQVGRDSVIIVMSDHGSRTHGHVERLSASGVDEQFSNFFASRAPDGEVLFPSDITPVNVLATVLNRYLDAGIQLSPNKIQGLDGTTYEDPPLVALATTGSGD